MYLVFSFMYAINLQYPLLLVRNERSFLALEQYRGLQAFNRVPDILGDVHPETSILVAEYHALNHFTVVVIGLHRHPASQYDNRLILRRVVVNSHHRPRLHRIQEPMAFLIQTLVEIEIHPKPRRRLRLRSELVEKMLVDNHLDNSNSLKKLTYHHHAQSGQHGDEDAQKRPGKNIL